MPHAGVDVAGTGIAAHAVFDRTVPRELHIRTGLQARRAAIVAGTLAPFAAPLVDNAGTTRLTRGALADADIKLMDWFVAGVVGSVPKAR